MPILQVTFQEHRIRKKSDTLHTHNLFQEKIPTFLHKLFRRLDVVAHAFKYSTPEVETGRSL